MSTKKPDISQIDQYLKGKLDARAMHKLERQAQDDPFLADALEGYEKAGNDQQANLAELNERLAKRVSPAKERSIILWRVLPIAASVLLMLGLGYWFFKPVPVKQQYANVIIPNKPQRRVIIQSPEKKETIVKQAGVAKNVIVTGDKSQASVAVLMPENPTIVKERNVVDTANKSRWVYYSHEGIWAPRPIYKNDTVEYIASDYNVRANAPVEDILKKMAGVEVSPDGSITFQGQAVTKAKLNGKDFAGGDVAQATKNLPADIIDKIQIVDDYGDQAAKTGIKDGNPTKILNLVPDTLNKNVLAKNSPQRILKEVSIAKSKALNQIAEKNNNSLNEVVVTGYATQKKPADCVENMEFKKTFFDHIFTIEKHTIENVFATKHTITDKALKTALQFLSKYTKVLTPQSYPNMDVFKADEHKWIYWYEANKCSNLK